MRSERCSKCDGRMDQGFVVDEGYGSVRVSRWQPGAPDKSFWLGVRQKKREQIEIQTWRCQRCGYLENYAPR